MIQNRFYFNFDIKTALILSLVVHSIIVFTEYIKVNKNPLDNLQIIVDLVPIPEPKKEEPKIEKPKPIEPPPVVEKPKPIEPPKQIEPPPVIQEPLPEMIEPIPQDIIPIEDSVPIYEEPIKEPVVESDRKVDEAKKLKEEVQLKQKKLDAVDLFTNNLAFHISKFKKYPRIAQRRGWQGNVVVKLVMSDTGNIQSLSIEQSSGYNALDEEAMKMIERAKPLPKPPEILAGDEINIFVPVNFALN